MRQVATIAVFNPQGKILMGVRRDNGRWTNPGGHLDEGEAPVDGAKRELFEETGLEINDLEHLCSKEITTHKGDKIVVHAYKCNYNGGDITTKEDPDAEVTKWLFQDCSNGLPSEVLGRLHSDPNVLLEALGLMGYEPAKYGELSTQANAKLSGQPTWAITNKAEEDLEKGADHKYLRRIPTGKQKPKYKYIYNTSTKVDAKPQVGEKIQIADDGQEGHYEIKSIHDDGSVIMQHDETGREVKTHIDDLHNMFMHEHEEAIRAKAKHLKATVKAATKYGSVFQKLKARQALKDFKEQYATIFPKCPKKATDKFSLTIKNKESAYKAILDASGIDNSDIAVEDKKYTDWKAGNGPKPAPFEGGHFDAVNEILNLKGDKRVSSAREAFDKLTVGVKTWAGIENALQIMREIPDFQDARVPEEAQELLNAMRWNKEIERLEHEAGVSETALGNDEEIPDSSDYWDFGDPEVVNKFEALWKAEQYKPTSDLVVTHNLSADNLHHAHELGGLAAPSLAVSHIKHPIQGFGGITLVGHPEMVDPKKDVPVFDADIYSPRHPKMAVELKDKPFGQLHNELKPHADATGGRVSDLREKLEGGGDPLGSYHHRPALLSAFLAHKGVNLTPPSKPANVKDWVNSQHLLDFRKKHGPVDHRFVYSDTDLNTPYFQDLGQAIKNSVSEGLPKDLKNDDDAWPSWLVDRAGNLNPKSVRNAVEQANKVGTTEIDTEAHRKQIEEAAKKYPESEIQSWWQDKIKPSLGKKYIPRRVDTYDGPKTRKIPYTLLNVLKQVTKTVRGGENFNYGLGSARALGALKFRSLDQVKDHAHRIVPKEQMKAHKEALDNKFLEIADKMKRYSEDPGSFRHLDNLSQAIGESFKRGKYLSKELRESGYKNVPQDLVQELHQLGQDLVHSPTEYFEAKPQRPVSIGEFRGAAVPHDTDPKTLNLLKQYGLPVEFYAKDNEDARAAAIQKLANVQKLHLSEKLSKAEYNPDDELRQEMHEHVAGYKDESLPDNIRKYHLHQLFRSPVLSRFGPIGHEDVFDEFVQKYPELARDPKTWQAFSYEHPETKRDVNVVPLDSLSTDTFHKLLKNPDISDEIKGRALENTSNSFAPPDHHKHTPEYIDALLSLGERNDQHPDHTDNYKKTLRHGVVNRVLNAISNTDAMQQMESEAPGSIQKKYGDRLADLASRGARIDIGHSALPYFSAEQRNKIYDGIHEPTKYMLDDQDLADRHVIRALSMPNLYGDQGHIIQKAANVAANRFDADRLHYLFKTAPEKTQADFLEGFHKALNASYYNDENFDNAMSSSGAVREGSLKPKVNEFVSKVKAENPYATRDKVYGPSLIQLAGGNTLNNPDTWYHSRLFGTRHRSFAKALERMDRSKYDPKDWAHALRNVTEEMWNDYENAVSPDHFAVVQRHITNSPDHVEIPSIRHPDMKGTSSHWGVAHEGIPLHAKEVQEAILADDNIPKYDIGGEPHVKVYRGVAGNYADALHDAAAESEQVDVPNAAFSSWSVEPSIALSFANRRISDQPRVGAVIRRTIPVSRILHSGYHTVGSEQSHRHEDEKELVIHHKDEPVTRVNRSDIGFKTPENKEIASNLKTAYNITSDHDNWHKSSPEFDMNKLDKGEVPLISISNDDQYLNTHSGLRDLPLDGPEDPGTQELTKGFNAKHLLGVAAATALNAMNPTPSLAQDSSFVQENQPKWKPTALATDMHPIAHMESNWGKNMLHAPHSKGEFHTAYGAVGLKPVTAHETYMNSKTLQSAFPNLHDKDAFLQKFRNDHTFYNTMASHHWNQLKRAFGGDTTKAAFAWRWGRGSAERAAPEQIQNDGYVKRYHALLEKVNAPK